GSLTLLDVFTGFGEKLRRGNDEWRLKPVGKAPEGWRTPKPGGLVNALAQMQSYCNWIVKKLGRLVRLKSLVAVMVKGPLLDKTFVATGFHCVKGAPTFVFINTE